MTESYRNEKELFNLQCWALTCETFLSTKEWNWVFKEFKYKGDYELIFGKSLIFLIIYLISLFPINS